MKSRRGYSLVELLVVVGILGVLIGVGVPVVWKMFSAASTAVAAHTMRQLSVASQLYLADHDNRFWQYREADREGVHWWFGFEPWTSVTAAEGERELDLERGPLGPFIASAPGRQKDPSFFASGPAFKPKFRNCHFPYGYNWMLQGRHLMSLADPGNTVVFATSAQVNTFQRPASPEHPMLEEFYLIDSRETTVHFRCGGKAMVVFADGSIGLLPMDESTRDARMPKANVGRFAPVGDATYLE